MFEWGPLVIPSFGFFMAVGFLLGSFFLWRRLKDDYPEEDLLTLSLVAGLFGLVGARAVSIAFGFERFGWNVSKWLALAKTPGLSMYGALLGVLVGTWLFSKKLSLRFWEVWDAVWEGMMWVTMFVGVGAFMSSVLPGRETEVALGVEMIGIAGKRHPVSLYIVGSAILILVIMAYVRANYRKYRWYPSGKVGFVGLFGTAVSGLTLLILESLITRGIYFGKFKLEQVFAAAIALLPILMIYLQSGRTVASDRVRVNKSLRGRWVYIKQKVRAKFRRG